MHSWGTRSHHFVAVIVAEFVNLVVLWWIQFSDVQQSYFLCIFYLEHSCARSHLVIPESRGCRPFYGLIRPSIKKFHPELRWAVGLPHGLRQFALVPWRCLSAIRTCCWSVSQHYCLSFSKGPLPSSLYFQSMVAGSVVAVIFDSWWHVTCNEAST